MTSTSLLQNPSVSVIVPVYNGAHHLPAALESAFDQTWQDFEIIVVDDGSTDGTSELLKSYESRVRIVRKSNGGASSARNAGIRLARGEFVAFLDSDDLWEPEKLALQVACLHDHAEIGVCFAECLYFDESKTWSANFGRHAPASGLMFDAILAHHFISMSSVMVRRKCLDEVGLFDETLIGCEDYNLYLRLAKKFPFRFFSQTLVKLRCHDGNLSNNLLQMCRDEIANLDKIVAMFPEMSIPKRQLCAEILFRFGQYHFDGHDFAAARDCFAGSIRNRPWRLSAYIYLLAAVLPDGIRHFLRSTVRAVRRPHAAS